MIREEITPWMYSSSRSILWGLLCDEVWLAEEWFLGVTHSGVTSPKLFITGIRDGDVTGVSLIHFTALFSNVGRKSEQIFSLNCPISLFDTLTGNFETDFCGDEAGDITGLGRSGLNRLCFATGILLTLALILSGLYGFSSPLFSTLFFFTLHLSFHFHLLLVNFKQVKKIVNFRHQSIASNNLDRQKCSNFSLFSTLFMLKNRTKKVEKTKFKKEICSLNITLLWVNVS